MLPLKIQTKESASSEDLKTNVLINLSMIENWIGTRYTTHNKSANLVSYGKSFKDDPAKVEDMGKGDIFAVKHTLPLFEGLSVKPKFCVILDPREVDGISTLGHRRRDLLKVYPETTYLVASMTHPSVTSYLLDNGAKVVGWHSACEAMKDPEVGAKVRDWITGGSCSAMRAVSLAKVMGYRNIRLLGYDAIVPEPDAFKQKQETQLKALLSAAKFEMPEGDFEQFKTFVAPALELYGAKKASALMPKDTEDKTVINLLDTVRNSGKLEYMRLAIGDSLMWCTPELAAMAVDIENTFKYNSDVVFEIFSGGVCEAIWNALGKAERINPEPCPLLRK